MERHSRKDVDEEMAEGMVGDIILEGGDTCRVRDTFEGLWLWATHFRAGTLLMDFSLWRTQVKAGRLLRDCVHG